MTTVDVAQMESLLHVPLGLEMAGMEVMSPMEVAMGFVPGLDEAVTPGPEGPGHKSPTEVLSALVLAALEHAPCLVEFSGGRDSSLLLAVAMTTARREGLSQPIAVTKRYPAVAESIEDEWQERVVKHLGVSEWVRLDFDAELDVIGPLAQGFVARQGVVFPPMLWSLWPFLQLARGGSLVSGEGGDEVFGVRRSRPLARLAYVRDFRRSTLRQAVSALAPRPVRAHLLRRRHRAQPKLAWLRPDVEASARELLVQEALTEPLDSRASLFWQRSLRREAMFLRNASRLAAAAGVKRAVPLLDPTFLTALGRAGGHLGYPSRTEALRANFSELLPDEVLSRRTKSVFNRAWFSRHAVSFAAEWDGSGLDEHLVDPEVLRGEWMSASPSSLSAAALQAAWLATERRRGPSEPAPAG